MLSTIYSRVPSSPTVVIIALFVVLNVSLVFKNLSSFGDGDDDGDSLAEADSAGSDASDSDSSVTITGRGRSSAPDRRRLGSGSGVKREKREPVPVSPPRQSIIAAAHEAEVGSQIKVKFDTGHWFGGTILEVDSQRWVL